MIGWVLFLWLLPFYEGSASPEGILISHLLFLATVALSASDLPSIDRRLGFLSLAFFSAAGVSAALGSYRFGSLLALADLALPLAVLALAEAAARCRPRFAPLTRLAIVIAGLVQAARILVAWVAGGFGQPGAGTLLNTNHAAAYLVLAFWALVAAGPARRGEGGARLGDAPAGLPNQAEPMSGNPLIEGPAPPRDRSGGEPPSGELAAWPSSPASVSAPERYRSGSERRGDSEAATWLGRSPAKAPNQPSDDPSRSQLAASHPASSILPNTLLVGFGAAVLLLAALIQASRGALLGLLAGGAVYACFRLPAMTRRARLIASLAATAVLLAGGGLIAQRLAKLDDPYAWERVRIWGVALQVTGMRPAAGVGPGLFDDFTAPFDLPHGHGPVRFSKHVEATHSDYLKILAETGTLGTSLFFLLAGMILLRALRAARRQGRWGAALAAAGAGLAVQAIFENLTARPALTCTGALLVGLLLSRTTPARDRTMAAALAAGQPPVPSGILGGTARRVAARILLFGGLGWAAVALVVAPYLGHRAFHLFRAGDPGVGARYAAANFWNPIHPDYRAALAEAVLAGRSPAPADLREAFLAVDEAIALKPIDPHYHLLRARLARAALFGGGAADWIALADESYGRAADLDPHRPLARAERGWMWQAVGGHARALEEAERALASEPNFLEARRLKAAALIDANRLNEAREEARAARARRDRNAAHTPSNLYEEQILRWDASGWEELEQRLESERPNSAGEEAGGGESTEARLGPRSARL